MSKFTQGPWAIDHDLIVGPDGFDICAVAVRKVTDVHGDTENEGQANARLIAAAPELLQLCDEQKDEIELSFERRAYACQRRIEEEEFDGTANSIIGDSVNVLFDAIDEAYVTAATVEDDEVNIDLDFSKVQY